MRTATCIEDLRQVARRRVPKMFFDYAEAGSYAEQTLRANRADLERVKLRQRVLIDVSQRDLGTSIVGQPVSLPLALAPVGLAGMQHPEGEIAACRAAHRAGIPFCLSTVSICSIEEVAAAVREPFWFQLYVMKDRGFVKSLVERAAAARCSALILTIDLQVLGQRHCDVRNGLTVPPAIRLGTLFDIALRPAWALGMLRGKRKTFGNLAGYTPSGADVASLASWISTQFDPALSWKDVEWIRGLWPGKLIVKGVLDVEDARLAAKTGANAIVVSNHGGRQLDGAPSSISALPAVADAVGADIEVMFDGGIRSGQDLLRALALGARSGLIGRAYIYGLGADGEAGVSKAIEFIRNEFDVTMALCGVRRIGDIDRRLIAS
ncbi:MAG: alpha-hydroxy-acid oxidizing protein [Hyphomicrobiales bacterium]|nr:alpha-hydroxy-acid oxidizing protein [Hyphomicrobiales bacterium]